MLVQIKKDPNEHKILPDFQYCNLAILEQQNVIFNL